MMKTSVLSAVFVISLAAWGCRPAGGSGETAGSAAPAEPIYNPPAPGFNAAGSDAIALSIADSAMEAMGGRRAWDKTHFIRWNFFGRRTLLWDKFTGMVRIEIPSEDAVYIVNINDGTGMARVKGAVAEPDSLPALMQQAKSIWINDSYWLVMPFKLKDSGVTLKFAGRGVTAAGEPCNILELTFEGVGDTPENKYQVYLSADSKLVRQWAYFARATDVGPNFITPWDDYKTYGGILLSSGRGERSLTDIAVLDTVPEGAFTSLEPLGW